MKPTAEYLNSIFEYRDGKIFSRVHSGKRKIGNEVGTLSPMGYFMVMVNKKVYRRHQIIFTMINGHWPKIVDHIDGSKSNDKIENLRECTQLENMRNRKKHALNKSGARGVTYYPNESKPYAAFISNNYKRIYLGRFKELSEASAAYEAASKVLYGEFARQIANGCNLDFK